MSKDDDSTLVGRIGAHAMHAKHDSKKTTEPGRAAFAKRFENQVDPDEVLDPHERSRRAEHAKKAYFTLLALKSAQARRVQKDRKKDTRT